MVKNIQGSPTSTRRSTPNGATSQFRECDCSITARLFVLVRFLLGHSTNRLKRSVFCNEYFITVYSNTLSSQNINHHSSSFHNRSHTHLFEWTASLLIEPFSIYVALPNLDCKTVVFGRFWKARSAVSAILACEARVSPHSSSPFSHSLQTALRLHIDGRPRSQKIRLFCSLYQTLRTAFKY